MVIATYASAGRIGCQTKLIHANSRMQPKLLHGKESDVWRNQAYQVKTEFLRQRAEGCREKRQYAIRES
jgi:hypothetical protein